MEVSYGRPWQIYTQVPVATFAPSRWKSGKEIRKGALTPSIVLAAISGSHFRRPRVKQRSIPGSNSEDLDLNVEQKEIPKRRLLLETDAGNIMLRLRPDSAPLTVEHVCRVVDAGLYDGCYFYRSDFVLQWGLWLPNETEVENPYPDIAENETNIGTFFSNQSGTVAIAHGIGVNGNSDIFINLEDNTYLDTMSLGFCVFAEVADASSYAVVRELAAAVKKEEKPVIWQASVVTEGVQQEKFPLAVSMQKSYDKFCSQWSDFKSILVVKRKDENG